jgi:hypothetical protein
MEASEATIIYMYAPSVRVATSTCIIGFGFQSKTAVALYCGGCVFWLRHASSHCKYAVLQNKFISEVP